MSKKLYCSFCGRELESGKCICEMYLKSKDLGNSKSKLSSNNTRYIVCDSCGKKVHENDCYCSYCGMPIHIDGNNEKLQRELQGENIDDALPQNTASKQHAKTTIKLSTLQIMFVAIIMLLIGFVFGIFIKPKIDSFINNVDTARLIDSESDSIKEETNNPVDKVNDTSPTEKLEPTNSAKSDVDSAPVNETLDTTAPTNDKEENSSANEKIKEDSLTNNKLSSNTTNSQNDTKFTGILKGVNVDKNNTLYVKEIKMTENYIKNGNETCSFISYLPIVDGADIEEVTIANQIINNAYNYDYFNMVQNFAYSSSEFPESIVINTVNQTRVTKDEMTIILQGKAYPKKGLGIKLKYRFLYDRKAKSINVMDVSAN